MRPPDVWFGMGGGIDSSHWFGRTTLGGPIWRHKYSAAKGESRLAVALRSADASAKSRGRPAPSSSLASNELGIEARRKVGFLTVPVHSANILILSPLLVSIGESVSLSVIGIWASISPAYLSLSQPPRLLHHLSLSHSPLLPVQIIVLAFVALVPGKRIPEHEGARIPVSCISVQIRADFLP